jgi:hypothetical protein
MYGLIVACLQRLSSICVYIDILSSVAQQRVCGACASELQCYDNTKFCIPALQAAASVARSLACADNSIYYCAAVHVPHLFY